MVPELACEHLSPPSVGSELSSDRSLQHQPPASVVVVVGDTSVEVDGG